MAVGLMKSLKTLGNPLMRCMMRLSKNPALRYISELLWDQGVYSGEGIIN
ncbi:hypothetical protein Patl1_35368 [Pistacia atlantica]|nr:hypothetical protein Patl1_35368 [Pistacia atlantica]